VSVSVTGIWRTPPSPTAPSPASPPDLIYVEPRVGLERLIGTCNVRRRDLTPTGSQDKRLEAEAAAQAVKFRVSNQIGIATGDVVAIEPDDVGRTDFVLIAGIVGGASANEAATIFTVAPLIRTHPRDAVVRPMTAAVAGTNNLLAADIAPADSTLLMASMSGFGGTHVEITDGIVNELRAMRLYQTVTGTDGSYRLPPISRVAQVEITAVSGANPPVNSLLRIDYSRGENRHDITIP